MSLHKSPFSPSLLKKTVVLNSLVVAVSDSTVYAHFALGINLDLHHSMRIQIPSRWEDVGCYHYYGAKQKNKAFYLQVLCL